MFLDHLSEIHNMRGQWFQTHREKGATPGRINHTLRATLQQVPSYQSSPTTFGFSRYMGIWVRKAGTKPDQHNPGTPKGWTTSEQDQSRLPHPKAQAEQLLDLPWQLDQRERTGCRWKGEDVGEGAELGSFSTPRPPFLPKQTLHCYPVVTVPQNVLLLVQPETLWGSSQKRLPVGSCCGGRKQLHKLGCHKIYPEDKRRP